MTPWSVAPQASLPLGLSKQEYWNVLPFPSPGDLPDLGIKPASPVLQEDSLPLSHLGKMTWAHHNLIKFSLSVSVFPASSHSCYRSLPFTQSCLLVPLVYFETQPRTKNGHQRRRGELREDSWRRHWPSCKGERVSGDGPLQAAGAKVYHPHFWNLMS